MKSIITIVVGILLTVQAQVMLPARRAITSVAGSSETTPLQLLTNLPYSAYSVARKLNSSWTGTAYRVWRPSDSNTLDIGFSGNLVNTNALASFCGTNSGYIDILYDQSGNNNHLDTRSSNFTTYGQILVTNGTIIVDEFNRPSALLRSDTFPTYIQTPTAVSPLSFTNALWFVGKPISFAGSGAMVNLGSYGQGAINISAIGSRYRMQIYNNPLSNGNNGDVIYQNKLGIFGAFFHTNNVDAAHYNTNVAQVFTAQNLNAGSVTWGYNGGQTCTKTYLTEMIYWNYLVSTNDWLRMRTNMIDFYTIQVTPSYIANTAVFDGSNDYMQVTNSSPTGITDGKAFTFSCWLKPGDDGNSELLLNYTVSGNARLQIFRTNGNKIAAYAQNSGGSDILYIISTTSVTATMGDWVHIYICVDLANTSNRHIYINGADDTLTVITYVNDTIDFTAANMIYTVGAQAAATSKLNGGLSELWWDDNYLNSVSSFFVNGHPISLGSNGSTPTGSQPPFYFKGSGNGFNINSGSAGDLVVIGSLGTTTPP